MVLRVPKGRKVSRSPAKEKTTGGKENERYFNETVT